MKMFPFCHGGIGSPLLLSVGAALFCSAALLLSQEEPPTGEWPRSYTVDDDDVVLYQPKVENWDKKSILVRFAAGVKGKNDEQPAYGSFLARAETLANMETRTVFVYNITAEDFKFPDAGNRIEQIKRDIAAVSPEKPLSVPLDELVNSVPSEEAVTKETVVTETQSSAPRIVVSSTPTLLLPFDGEPVFREIPDSGLQSAVNTSATLLRPEVRKSPLYLLTNDGQWLTADTMDGPWQAGKAPLGLKFIPVDHPVSEAVQNAGPPEKDVEVPDVLVTTTPTELIQLQGKPAYHQIGDSPLVRVENTDTPLFYHFEQRAFYVLISGRWFRAEALKGPWDYVAQNVLPEEFAEIPQDDPSANVRASIAGTPEAEAAAVEAQVPVKAQVSLRDEPELEVDYDGEPSFQEVEGTGCAYAVNTTYEVLRIGGRYYCCYDGVWFVATRPEGVPWHLVKVLPQAILTLPPSCPLYHLRFCTVDSYEDDVVTYSCTAGYWGTYIDPVTQVCVYGTGFDYPAYVSLNYYAGYPLTYGYGCRWWPHHGFGYAGHHVAQTAWAAPLLRRGSKPDWWRARTDRWGGHLHKGPWPSPAKSGQPFYSWGKKVVTHHEPFIAGTSHHRVQPKEGPKPLVVFHSNPMERRLAGFQQGLRAGDHGEVLRRNVKGWEQRQPGKWVVHPEEPKAIKRVPVVTHARTDSPTERGERRILSRSDDTRAGKGELKKDEFEIRPAEPVLGDRKRQAYVIPPQALVVGDKGLGERPVGTKRMEEKPVGERRVPSRVVVRPDEIPQGRPEAVHKADATPVERRVIVPSGVVRRESTVEPRENPRVERHESRIEPQQMPGAQRIEHSEPRVETRVSTPRAEPRNVVPRSEPQPVVVAPRSEPKIEPRAAPKADPPRNSGGQGQSQSQSQGNGGQGSRSGNSGRDNGRGDDKKRN